MRIFIGVSRGGAFPCRRLQFTRASEVLTSTPLLWRPWQPASPWTTQFPFFSGALALYLRHTRKDAVGSSPSLCPADHSAGISHSRPRFTVARGCSCRYVSLSGSLAPLFHNLLRHAVVVAIFHMSLSHICLVQMLNLRNKQRTSFSDSAIAL